MQIQPKCWVKQEKMVTKRGRNLEFGEPFARR